MPLLIFTRSDSLCKQEGGVHALLPEEFSAKSSLKMQLWHPGPLFGSPQNSRTFIHLVQKESAVYCHVDLLLL